MYASWHARRHASCTQGDTYPCMRDGTCPYICGGMRPCALLMQCTNGGILGAWTMARVLARMVTLVLACVVARVLACAVARVLARVLALVVALILARVVALVLIEN